MISPRANRTCKKSAPVRPTEPPALAIIRQRTRELLRKHKLTQRAFCVKHDLSYTWLTKFLQGLMTNPRYSSIEKLQEAMEAEFGQIDWSELPVSQLAAAS